MLERTFIHTDDVSEVHSPFFMVRFQIRKKQQEINLQLKVKTCKKINTHYFQSPHSTSLSKTVCKLAFAKHWVCLKLCFPGWIYCFLNEKENC